MEVSSKRISPIVMSWPGPDGAGDNPYVRQLCTSVSTLGGRIIEFSPVSALVSQFDVLHVHWPESTVRRRGLGVQGLAFALGTLVLLALVRLRRATVVWTVHNVRPHGVDDSFRLRLFYRTLVRCVSGCVFLTHSSRQEAAVAIPEIASLPYAIIMHGRYDDEYVPAADRESVRERLGVTPRQLLVSYIGAVHKYKGPHHLLEAFHSVRDTGDDDVRVMVAGPGTGTYVDSVFAEVNRMVNGIGIRERLPSAKYAELVSASDLVVYPYQRITNSGSVLVPLELSVPVLVPRLGSMEEVSDSVGEGWLLLYDGDLTIDVIRNALATSRPSEPDLSNFSWSVIGRDTLAFYDRFRRVQ